MKVMNTTILAPLALMISTSIINVVMADGWFYQTTFSSSLEADDNKRLRTDDEKGVVGANARVDIKLSNVTEISEVYVRGALRSVRYDGSEDRGIDTDDQLLYAGGRWNGERSQFSIDGEFLRQSSQLTELTDTGFFDDVDRRVTKSLAPQYSYVVFENTQAFVGLNYEEVDFPNSIPVNLTEYTVEGGNLGVIHTIDELNSVTASVFHSQYEADTFSNEVDTTGANIRYARTINELWNAYAQVGYRKSNFKNLISGVVVRDDDTGESYNIGATRQSELSTLNVSASNELQPSASGDVNERLTLNFDYNRSFSDYWVGIIDFIWLNNESVNNDGNDNDREYWQLTLGADYRITPTWTATARLRHREQNRDDISGSRAESDAVILGIRYAGKNKRIQ